MQRREDNVAARLNGNALQPLAEVQITVTDDKTGLPASLYSDNGVTPITQPLVTDFNGYYGYYAANGEYTETFTSPRIASFTRKVVLADPDDNPHATKAELAAGAGSSLVTFTQAGTGAVSRTLQARGRDVVSVKDFGAKGDGVTDDTAAFAAAIAANAGRELFVHDGDYLLTSPVTLPDNTALRMSSGARVFTNLLIDSIFVLGNNCAVLGGTVDANNSKGALQANTDGATYAIKIINVSGCRVEGVRVKRFRRGVEIESTVVGTKAANHQILRNVFDAYHSWPSSIPDNGQLGIYCGSTASPNNTQIGSFATSEMEASDVYGIVVDDNVFISGMYGVAAHRTGGISITGNVFSEMSRAVSLQAQTHNFTVSGNTFSNLHTTAVHMAYGAHNGSVTGNTIRGVMANDNGAIQAYYGCRNLTITGNTLDSQFDQWDGGPYLDQRVPNHGIRIGQAVSDIVIDSNNIRGYAAAIRVLSTVYYSSILNTDINYQRAGFKNITIANNNITFAYEVTVATATKLQFLQSNSYGIQVFKSGGWEDTVQGSFHCKGLRVSGNTVDGARYPYTIEKATNTATNPVNILDAWWVGNYAINSLGSDALTIIGLGTSDTIYGDGNSWVETFTPSISGATTAGSHTYTNRNGKYYRRGKIIFFEAFVTVSTKDAAMAGTVELTGLPVTSKAGEYQAVTVSLWNGFTLGSTFTHMGGYIQPATSKVTLLKNGSGLATAFIGSADCGATMQLSISGSYMID